MLLFLDAIPYITIFIFGITIGSFRWSPAVYVYPEYNGLYTANGQQLYVSRGVGYLGFAGRIGQRPEITLIKLTNDCK